MTLDEVIKVTSRRVNALEHVVIPRIQGNIHYIKKVLDEQAREDFYRQKKLTDKKKAESHKRASAKEERDEAYDDTEPSAVYEAINEDDEGKEDLIF